MRENMMMKTHLNKKNKIKIKLTKINLLMSLLPHPLKKCKEAELLKELKKLEK